MGPVRGLHLVLLVDAKHDCVLGRAEIKPHNRLELFGGMRIIADLEWGLSPWAR
jgi:hypothetical protein